MRENGNGLITFSVIIPAHDDAATITAAIGSALDAVHGAHEVIVVDDGSVDDTTAIAATITDPRVVILSQEKSGPGAARNAGAARATGSHLVFLDADDELLPDAFDVFTGGDPADRDPPLLIRAGVVIRAPHDVDRTGVAQPNEHDYPRGTQLTGSFAIARSLFEEIGGYDPEFEFGENSELLLRASVGARAHAAPVAFRNRPTFIYNKKDDGPTRQDHYRARKLAAIYRMFDKHDAALANDREILADHLAILTTNLLADGQRVAAVRAGARAIAVQPRRVRSWGRLARCFLPTRRSVSR